MEKGAIVLICLAAWKEVEDEVGRCQVEYVYGPCIGRRDRLYPEGILRRNLSKVQRVETLRTSIALYFAIQAEC
jgi:hypothetical protein